MIIARNFGRGVMNKDVDERLLPDGQYRDALNITVGSSESSNIGSIQNIMGNEIIDDLVNIVSEDVVNAKAIGAIAVESINIIFWLVASDFFDGIFQYDVSQNEISRVIQSNKSGPDDPSQLNFNQSYTVTGINYIAGMLLWTDDLNEPFKINVSRARTYAVSDPRIDNDIRLITPAPLYSPYIVMNNDGTQSNNMSEKFLYFATRFKRLDNEYTSLSPFTTSAFTPGDYEFDPQKGYNAAMVNESNKVDITFLTGDEFVKEIQLVMLDSTSKNVFIIDSFKKDELNISDNTSYTYAGFSNNKTYTSLPSSQVTRLFDNVPIKAKAQEQVGTRIAYGNYVQFYDIRDVDGNDISVDFAVSYRNDLGTPSQTSPLQTFRSDRDYEIGIVYTDAPGRLSTVLTSITNTTYIRPEDAARCNSLVVDIKSKAPAWAVGWRLAIKQSRNDYYNLFPILFYKDGNYRYLLLNESDRDKLSVGDYVIFKAGPNGVTGSNKQYKVLEIAQKEAGFIPGGTGELAGLYFKIKVDSASEFSPAALYSYSGTGEGANTTNGGLINNGEIAPSPVFNPFQVAENPVFYGDGDGSVLTVSNSNAYSGVNDLRYTIEIDSATTFRYTTNLDGTAPFVTPVSVTIVANTDIPILFPGPGATAFNIRFSTTTGFVVGDKWKVSCRGTVYATTANTNYFGGIGICQLVAGTSPGFVGGYAIIPTVNWSPTTPNETDRPINVGAIITLNVIEDRYNPNAQAGVQQFPPSDRNYVNIEEWFVESGAYLQFQQIDLNNNNVGSKRISFRRGSAWQQFAGFSPGGDLSNTVNQGGSATAGSLANPVRMFIAGCGIDDGPNNQNHIRVQFTIQQQNNSNIVETVPKPNDIDIYHELSRTYPVDEDGYHLVNWAYEDFIFFQSSGPYNGYTALTQLTPSVPHYFEVGETIEVVTTIPSINGTQTVVAVPDQFTVVIDLLFPGSGPVTPGTIAHNVIDTDQTDFPNIATVVINNPSNQNSTYNAWSFGNGLESNRIKDDFNQSVLEYSIRSLSAIEDYKQIRNESAITYSGVFKENTSVNRLNEFNLSEANFKYLDKSFGSIQKMFTRDTDLIVFQENKVSYVLYGKNLLSDAIGGGQVASVPEVLGNQIAFQYENGISKNPESFAAWGADLFFTDAYRGSVLQLTGNEILDISQFGMKNYFRDLFRDAPNTRKIGTFDPFRKVYVLASNDTSSVPCNLSINPSELTLGANAYTNAIMFSISSDSSWGVRVLDIGFGTAWVPGFPIGGQGDAVVHANVSANTSGALRMILFEIAYCGGLVQNFILTQTRGKVIGVTSAIFSNSNPNESITKL